MLRAYICKYSVMRGMSALLRAGVRALQERRMQLEWILGKIDFSGQMNQIMINQLIPFESTADIKTAQVYFLTLLLTRTRTGRSWEFLSWHEPRRG